MPTLRRLQELLSAEILARGRGEAPRDSALIGLLRLPAGVDAATRLDVYRDGYPSRVIEALQEGLPATANILGEGSFGNLARRCMAAVDLGGYGLNDVAAGLAEYCGRDPLARELPFLADLVELEWSVLRAFHAEQADPIHPAALSSLTMEEWESAVLAFQPAVRLVDSDWPIVDLWETRDADRSEIDVDLNDRPQTGLVHRDGYDVRCRIVATAESRALATLLNGNPLGAAIESLERAGHSPEATISLFAGWIAGGLVTGVRRNRTAP